jgi:hypothetical protein
MGDVANQVQHEFWRPPIQPVASDVAPSQEFIETCRRCGTEFIVSSRFCHSCGATRPELNPASRTLEIPGLSELSALGVRLGLTTASLIAFLVGTICIVGALAVGVVFSARTLLDWQAIQIWRIEWLLGAVASFLAGFLLKKSS